MIKKALTTVGVYKTSTNLLGMAVITMAEMHT
jgi:hypothetical protein